MPAINEDSQSKPLHPDANTGGQIILDDPHEDLPEDDYANLWPFSRWLCRIVEWGLGILLLVVFVLNVVNVIGRRATDFTPAWFEGVARFFSSLGWIDEASRFIIIWVGFLGAAIVYAANKHVSLTILIDRMRSTVARVLRIIQTLVVLGVFGVMFWFGYQVVRYAINRSTALDLPMSLVYSCVPAAALIGIYFAIEKLVRHGRALRSDNPTEGR